MICHLFSKNYFFYRRGSSRQNESSSQSAPGSPKLEVRASYKPVNVPVLSPSTELPEEPELKSQNYEHLRWTTVRQNSGDQFDTYDMSQVYSPGASVISSSSTGIGSSVGGGSGLAPSVGGSDVTTGNSVSTTNINGSAQNVGLKQYAGGPPPPVTGVTGVTGAGKEGISKAVAAAVAAAGYDSEESELEQHQQTSSNRSRQKKFLKNFKQLPQEEVVLQRKCVLGVNRKFYFRIRFEYGYDFLITYDNLFCDDLIINKPTSATKFPLKAGKLRKN